jgi:hypothetical protein
VLGTGDQADFGLADETLSIPLPGFSSLPLPSTSEWSAFQEVVQGLERCLRCIESLSTDQIRFALIVELCRNGVPYKNIHKRRGLYKFGSFLFTPTSGFFAVLTRQSDRGLGLCLVELDRTNTVFIILRELRRRFGDRPKQYLFADFDLSRTAFAKFVRSLLCGNGSNMARLDDARILSMTDACSTLISLMKQGGLLTYSARDMLIVPANYFEPTDLLAARGIPNDQILGTDGMVWRNPYAPTREQLDRLLDDKQFFELLGLSTARHARGRPRTLPPWFSGYRGHLLEMPECLIARLIAHYKPWPDAIFIRDLLARAGCSDERVAARIYPEQFQLVKRVSRS